MYKTTTTDIIRTKHDVTARQSVCFCGGFFPTRTHIHRVVSVFLVPAFSIYTAIDLHIERPTIELFVYWKSAQHIEPIATTRVVKREFIQITRNTLHQVSVCA